MNEWNGLPHTILYALLSGMTLSVLLFTLSVPDTAAPHYDPA